MLFISHKALRENLFWRLKAMREGSMIRKHSRYDDRFSAIQSHPRIELRKNYFLCNGVALDLSRKTMAAKVIKAFMASPRGVINRDQLILLVHSKSPSERRSKRFVEGRNACLTRMISRLRFEFSMHFHSVIPNGVHWFYYDQNSENWVFYKLAGEGYDGEFYN